MGPDDQLEALVHFTLFFDGFCIRKLSRKEISNINPSHVKGSRASVVHKVQQVLCVPRAMESLHRHVEALTADQGVRGTSQLDSSSNGTCVRGTNPICTLAARTYCSIEALQAMG